MSLRNEDDFYNVEADTPVTRDERLTVRIICTDRKANSSNPQKTIVALVKEKDGTETPRTYFANGRFSETEKHYLDLVNMGVHKATISVYRSKKSGALRVTTDDIKDKVWELVGTKDIAVDVLL